MPPLNFILLALWHLILTLPAFIVYKCRHYITSVFSLVEDIPGCKNEKVVILLHGRGGHPSHFDGLVRNLVNLGCKHRIVRVYCPQRDNNIDVDGMILANELAKFNNCSITLVGLSKGGLTAIYYAKYLHASTNRTGNTIEKIITIASPVQGTVMTEFLSPNDPARVQFNVGSSFLKKLAQPTDVSIPTYHIVPEYDHMVIPQSNTALPGNIVFKYTGFRGHIGIPYSRAVARTIYRWITNE